MFFNQQKIKNHYYLMFFRFHQVVCDSHHEPVHIPNTSRPILTEWQITEKMVVVKNF